LTIFSTKITKLIEFILEKHKYPKISGFHPKEKERKLFRIPNLSLAKISFFFTQAYSTILVFFAYFSD
jgi:hypothetical protein